MKVRLINYTPDAMDILIFTKQTRLSMTAARFEDVKAMPLEKKLEELKYMAGTIPSSWEFVDYTFSIEEVSRGFTHQFVRTRTNSYAQQSMRVNDMSRFEYITGPGIEPGSVAEDIYSNEMTQIGESYQRLLHEGVPIEDARGVLPTNIATNIIAKINLRTLSDMARSRTGGRTQSEYQQVMQLLILRALEVHPWADMFLYPKSKGFFDEIEEFAKDLGVDHKNGEKELLKIIDKMRKAL